MSGRRFALIAGFAFLLMFIASNLVVNSWFRSWRLDLTENHLYSLSHGTQQVLDALSEPVELKLYYSRDAATSVPSVQTYGARVREMLQTFAARSHGRVRFVELNVKRFTEEEDQAVEAGIDPQTLYEGADPLYFGLVGANAINDTRTIPFFDPRREPFLEYEITRLIYELENPDPTHVALITSLPMDPARAADTRMQGASGQSVFATELGRLLHVTKLEPNFTEIPADTDVLAILHPAPLTPVQAYAVDQFILRKGRAFIALDPASIVAQQQAGQFAQFGVNMGEGATSSNLDPLLAAWGVQMSSDVVLDVNGALDVNVQGPNGQTVRAPQPLFFLIDREHLDRRDLMTAWLNRGINFGLAGSLTASERPNLTVTRLATTSENTLRMEAERALLRPSPFDLMNEPPQAGRIETVALRLSGTLPTAFPNGPPPEAPPAPNGAAPLRQSATRAEVVLVADTDFLADEFFMNPQSGTPLADNASFALNAIDVLGGSDALVSLRSRAPSTRSMKMLDDMEAEAQRHIQREQDRLQQELQDTESRLAALQSRGRGSGFFSGNLGAELTPDENREIENFRTHVTEVRRELRTKERDLRSNISALQALILFFDVWFAPLLVAGAGLFLFWRRQRRGKARS